MISEMCSVSRLIAWPAHGRQRRFAEGHIIRSRLTQPEEFRADAETLVGVPDEIVVRNRRLGNAVHKVRG